MLPQVAQAYPASRAPLTRALSHMLSSIRTAIRHQYQRWISVQSAAQSVFLLVTAGINKHGLM
jgi:hypothetical protein